MSILRYRQDDLPTGIWNATVLSAPFWLLISLLLLSGCAQWDQMTPQERRVVIGTGVAAALVAGAVAAHNEDEDVPPAAPVWKPWDHRPSPCQGRHCK